MFQSKSKLSKDQRRITVATATFAEYDSAPLSLLQKFGRRVVLNTYRRKLKPEETVNLGRNAVGILAGTELYDEAVLTQLPRLEVLSRCGVGLDNIDLAYAEKRGIKIFNTPDAPTDAVAELTLGLILNLLRRINLADRSMREGMWEEPKGHLLQGKKVGIIGFGRIGQKVAKLLVAFGTEVAFYDTNSNLSPEGIPRKTLDELLSWSDVVSLHCSNSNSEQFLMGRRELELMRKGSYLLNTARGCLIDEGALKGALEERHLAGAALDVYSSEPYQGPLCALENVILTPHMGSYARESRIAMEMEAVQNLLKGLTE